MKPKVNVKPSVVKPPAQPAQKRKVSKVPHSAVAEVKPLNAARQTPSAPVFPNKRQKVRFCLLSLFIVFIVSSRVKRL